MSGVAREGMEEELNMEVMRERRQAGQSLLLQPSRMRTAEVGGGSEEEDKCNVARGARYGKGEGGAHGIWKISDG